MSGTYFVDSVCVINTTEMTHLETWSCLPNIYVCMITVALLTTDSGWFGFYMSSSAGRGLCTHLHRQGFVRACIFIVCGTTCVLELHTERQYSRNIITMYADFIKLYGR